MIVFVDQEEWFVMSEPIEGKGSTRLEVTDRFYARWKAADKEFHDCQEELRKLYHSIGEVAGPMSPSKPHECS